MLTLLTLVAISFTMPPLLFVAALITGAQHERQIHSRLATPSVLHSYLSAPMTGAPLAQATILVHGHAKRISPRLPL